MYTMWFTLGTVLLRKTRTNVSTTLAVGSAMAQWRRLARAYAKMNSWARGNNLPCAASSIAYLALPVCERMHLSLGPASKTPRSGLLLRV